MDVFYIDITDKSFHELFILCILNSKVMLYWLQFNCKKKGKIFEFYQKPLSQIPIPKVLIEKQIPFVEKAKKMLSLYKKLNEKKSTFFEWLENAFDVKKIGEKLSKMQSLSKDEFTKELGKAKVNVKDMEIFNQCIKVYKDIKAIKDDIDRTDAEIDEMVFDLYDLTDDERQIIRESV